MKKKILLLCVAFIFYSNIAFSFSNEPDGFRQYKWGMGIEEIEKVKKNDRIQRVPKNVSYDGEGVTTYNIFLKDKKISGESIDNFIMISLYNNKLYNVCTGFDLMANSINQSKIRESRFTRLTKAMHILYGKESNHTFIEKNKAEEYIWKGKKVRMSLSTSKDEFDETLLIIKYLPIEKEIQEKQKKAYLEKIAKGW
jgi:hypothetical protein